VALVIARITHGLLIGESAAPEEQARALVLTESVPDVKAVTQLLTMHLGPDVVILAMKIRLSGRLDAAAIEAATNLIEERVRAELPQMRKIFVEVDSRGDGRGLAPLREIAAVAEGRASRRPRRKQDREAARGDARAPRRRGGAHVSPCAARRGRSRRRSGGGAARGRVGLVFDVGAEGTRASTTRRTRGSFAPRRSWASRGVPRAGGERGSRAAMRLFAARGLDLVIGVGFIFSSDVDRVARDYPRVRFACIDYAPPPGGPPPNVEGLGLPRRGASFLVGAVAGFVSKTHEVGFVGGMTGPLIRNSRWATRPGERACRECVVHSAYAGASPDAFRDPAKGRRSPSARSPRESDVIYHAAGAVRSRGVRGGAREHVWAIGGRRRPVRRDAGTVLTSMVKRGDVAVFDSIRAGRRGRFEPGIHELGSATARSATSGRSARRGDSRRREAKGHALRDEVVRGELRVPFRVT